MRNSTKQNIKTLQILQNRAARAVLGNFDFNSSVNLMIKQLKWTTVQNRYTYLLLSAAEGRGSLVLLSASVSHNSGNSSQMAAPRR